MKNDLLIGILAATYLSLFTADKLDNTHNNTTVRLNRIVLTQAENRWLNEPIVTCLCCNCTREDIEDCTICSLGCAVGTITYGLAIASDASPLLQYIIGTAGHVIGSQYIGKEFQAWHRSQQPIARLMLEQKQTLHKKMD